MREAAARRSDTVSASSLRNCSIPAPVTAEVTRTPTPRAVPRSRAAGAGHRRSPRPLGAEQVGLVEHDGDHLGVAGQRHQVAPVYRRVRVLLRVEHPDHQVGHPDQPVDLAGRAADHRVVVGQVQQHQAVERLLAAVQRAAPRVAVAARDAEPFQQRAGARHAPDAGVRVPGHRPGHPDGGEVRPGEPVEERGLAAAGAAGQGHDRVRRRTAAAARPARSTRASASSIRSSLKPSAAGAGRGDLDQPGQRGEPGRQPKHRRTGLGHRGRGRPGPGRLGLGRLLQGGPGLGGSG